MPTIIICSGDDPIPIPPRPGDRYRLAKGMKAFAEKFDAEFVKGGNARLEALRTALTHVLANHYSIWYVKLDGSQVGLTNPQPLQSPNPWNISSPGGGDTTLDIAGTTTNKVLLQLQQDAEGVNPRMSVALPATNASLLGVGYLDSIGTVVGENAGAEKRKYLLANILLSRCGS
jgi:hypothetical protein